MRDGRFGVDTHEVHAAGQRGRIEREPVEARCEVTVRERGHAATEHIVDDDAEFGFTRQRERYCCHVSRRVWVDGQRHRLWDCSGFVLGVRPLLHRQRERDFHRSPVSASNACSVVV